MVTAGAGPGAGATLGYATRIPGERFRWGMVSIVVIVVIVLVCGVGVWW